MHNKYFLLWNCHIYIDTYLYLYFYLSIYLHRGVCVYIHTAIPKEKYTYMYICVFGISNLYTIISSG